MGAKKTTDVQPRPRRQGNAAVEPLLGNMAPQSTPRSRRYGDDDDDDDDDNRQERRSVMSKVKDREKKRQDHDADSGSSDADDDEDGEDEDDDKERHGAPMYESELAPDVYRGADDRKALSPRKEKMEQAQSDTVDQKVPPSEATAAVMASEEGITAVDKEKETITSNDVDQSSNDGRNRTLSRTVSDMLAPAYAMVSEATTMLASKMQYPVREEAIAKQMWDKGLTMKEYLLQKLEPGEDERALSQVITEAISPASRYAGSDTGGGVGVVEKVKDAVSSVFGGSQTPATSTDNQPPTIPVSTMPHAASVPTNLTSPRAPKQVTLSRSMPRAVARNQQYLLACSRSRSMALGR